MKVNDTVQFTLNNNLLKGRVARIYKNGDLLVHISGTATEIRIRRTQVEAWS